MKSKTKSHLLVPGVVALALLASPVVNADQTSAIKKTFSKVPAPELAAQAAKLVSQAPAKEQESVAIAAVRAAVEKSRTVAPIVVSSVARAVPAVAPAAAATAAVMEPKQAGSIAKAAAAAAPSQAGEIVFAIARDLPGSYAIAAIGASEGAPQADADILAAISRAIPSLKPVIAQASTASLPRSDYASAITPVILQVQTLLSASTPVQLTSVSGASSGLQLVQGPPPGGGGPFVPGTQGNGDPQRKHTQLVQPGEGRIYSGP